jgi:hypothetical protein
MTEEELLEGFETCTLPNTSFHHADHVHVVWSYLRRWPLPAALERFQTALKRFATHHGVPGLYHETITCAFAVLVNERIQADPGVTTWEEFCERNPEVLTWRPSILDRYYRRETLESDRARRIFLFPDRLSTEIA